MTSRVKCYICTIVTFVWFLGLGLSFSAGCGHLCNFLFLSCKMKGRVQAILLISPTLFCDVWFFLNLHFCLCVPLNIKHSVRFFEDFGAHKLCLGRCFQVNNYKEQISVSWRGNSTPGYFSRLSIHQASTYETEMWQQFMAIILPSEFTSA